MAALKCLFLLTRTNVNSRPPCISCSIQNNIKVVINGAAKEIGRAAVVAVTKARGMEVAGAVDSQFLGDDIGKLCDMEEALEIPIINDLTMVLASISQSNEPRVLVDFTDPSTVYDNIKQATAFGIKSVVYVPRIKPETVTALSAFCEKASMGCLVAPTLSIGSILLQQAAITASFHYNNVEIVESRANASDLPSPDAIQIASNLSNLGQIYNRQDLSTDVVARGQVLGEDGVRVHSMILPGLPSSTTVYFSGSGDVCFPPFSSFFWFEYSVAYSPILFYAFPIIGLLHQTRRHQCTVPHARPALGYKKGCAPKESGLRLGEIYVEAQEFFIEL